MERMTKVDENIQTAQNLLSWIVERCYELEEENKKLREELSSYDREYFDEDKKAENIYKSQKENILMGKI